MFIKEAQCTKVGVGVIITREDRVLLGLRKGSHGAGTWAFPGGHLELGETPEECAYREVKEETGLEVLQLIPGGWANFFDQGKRCVTLFIIVTEFSGEPQVLEPLKCEKWDWFKWDDLPQPLFAPVETLIKNFERVGSA